MADVCDMLKVLGLQAWTQPLRHDETDKNVVQIERFRQHVWWVGGNALAYRSLLPVAVMYQSVPMIELLAEVANGESDVRHSLSMMRLLDGRLYGRRSRLGTRNAVLDLGISY